MAGRFDGGSDQTTFVEQFRPASLRPVRDNDAEGFFSKSSELSQAHSTSRPRNLVVGVSVIHPKTTPLKEDPVQAAPRTVGMAASRRSPAETCARIKSLGYCASKHISMYGEHFELVSDPVEEGDCTVVQALSGSDPAIRTVRLPVSILLGLTDRSGQKTKFGK